MASNLNSEFNYRYQVIGSTPWEKIKTLQGFYVGRKRAAVLEEVAELKYQASLTEPRKQKADVETEIEKLSALLEKSKGSFAEWLDENKKGWQDNIGKVVDEESILYNNVLAPQLSSPSETSLFGVGVNLAAVERKFRTPEELKKK